MKEGELALARVDADPLAAQYRDADESSAVESPEEKAARGQLWRPPRGRGLDRGAVPRRNVEVGLDPPT
jgi:hypothetical protein